MYESVPFLVKCTSSSGTALVASFTEVGASPVLGHVGVAAQVYAGVYALLEPRPGGETLPPAPGRCTIMRQL